MPTPPLNHAYAPGNGIEAREYYAAFALMGLLANPQTMSARITQAVNRKFIAAIAYLIADEMVTASSLPVPTLQANVAAADLERNA
jgi:hypothetical protein